MTTPLWTLLVATILPYVWFSISNPLRKREFGTLDNNHPRLQQARLTGAGARALAASANAFEALAVYVPAVLVAHLVAPGSTLAPKLAVAWVILRVAHGAAYLANNAALRTLFFALATFCSLGFYLIAAQVL